MDVDRICEVVLDIDGICEVDLNVEEICEVILGIDEICEVVLVVDEICEVDLGIDENCVISLDVDEIEQSELSIYNVNVDTLARGIILAVLTVAYVSIRKVKDICIDLIVNRGCLFWGLVSDI